MKNIPAGSGDDGKQGRYLGAALAAFGEQGDSAIPGVHAAVLDARVFVPIIATLGERDEVTGGDKSSQMELLTFRYGDGDDAAEALLVFTGIEEMQRWRSDVRPVPISAVDACGVAVERDYDAVIFDLAGPVRFVVDDDDLDAIARGYQPIADSEGLSAKQAFDVDIRRVATLPDFAQEAVDELDLTVVPLEVEEGDGQWRPAIGLVVDGSQPIADIAQRLSVLLTEAIDLVPLTPAQAQSL